MADGLDRWRDFFRGAGAGICDVIENAILVAAADAPRELLHRRDRIAERLFTAHRRDAAPPSLGSAAASATPATPVEEDKGSVRRVAEKESKVDSSSNGAHGGGRGHGDEDRRWTPRLLNDNVPMQLMQRIRMDAEAEEMTPRACGLMVFFPWSAKPAVCGFRGSLAPAATPRPGADAPSPRPHSRRITTTTLGDVIKEDNEAAGGDSRQPRGEKKRGREDAQQSRRWGVSSLLDTSKKYCTDARKALSKLSIGLGADSGSPRVSSEGRRGRLRDGFSSTPATPAKLTQLKANRN